MEQEVDQLVSIFEEALMNRASNMIVPVKFYFFFSFIRKWCSHFNHFQTSSLNYFGYREGIASDVSSAVDERGSGRRMLPSCHCLTGRIFDIKENVSLLVNNHPAAVLTSLFTMSLTPTSK